MTGLSSSSSPSALEPPARALSFPILDDATTGDGESRAGPNIISAATED